MSDTITGRRLPVDEVMRRSAPSACYGKVPEDSPQYRSGIRWIVRYGAALGSLREGIHTVEEHADGTITVNPSIIMPSNGPERWHGWLRHGVFEGAFESVPSSGEGR